MVKKLLTSLLILLALSVIGFNFVCASAKAEVKKEDGLIVYYFYAKPRCVSCQKIENYTKEAVESLNNSAVELKTVNLDDPENKHYYKDYGLYTKSVVLSKIKNGKEIEYKNLDKIWMKLGNEKEFKQYVTDEINKIMEK